MLTKSQRSRWSPGGQTRLSVCQFGVVMSHSNKLYPTMPFLSQIFLALTIELGILQANGDGTQAISKDCFGFTRLFNASMLVPLSSTLSEQISSTSYLSRKYQPMALEPNFESLEYNGGRVLNNPIPINIVFYGPGWPGSRVTIVKDFISSLSTKGGQGVVPGVNQWWKICQDYTDSNNSPVSNKVLLQTVLPDSGSIGTERLQPNSMQNILKNAFNKGTLKPSSSGINLILTGPDVTISGFCSKWCGLHQSFKYKNFDIVYAIIGNPQSQCPGQCSIYSAFRYSPPNGDMGADAMVNIIAHNIVAAATNPDGNAWFHSLHDNYHGFENSDFCSFKFSSTFSDKWSVPKPVVFSHIGVKGRKFYIQDNYSLRKQACVTYE